MPRKASDGQQPGEDHNRPLSDPEREASETYVDVRRLMMVVFVVAASAVFVVTMRLWCVVFAGLLLGVFLYRLSDMLQRHSRLPYRAAFACVVIAFVGLGVGAGLFFVPRLATQMGDLSSKVTASVEELLARLREWGWVEEVAQQTPQVGSRLLGSLDATALLGGVFSSVSIAVTATFVVGFVGFFLAAEPGLYRRGLLQLVVPEHRRRVDELLHKGVDTLWRWMLGRLVAMTIIGVAISIGLWVIGIPLAVTLGTLAGVVSFVPTIGGVFAIIPALLVAFQQGSQAPLYVLGLYLAVQAVENNLITPLVQQQAVSVPPVVVIVSQVLMGLLVGVVGVIIATPLTALALRLVRETCVRDPMHSGNGSASPAAADQRGDT